MLSDKSLVLYFDRMIGRLYKILPLKESGEKTISDYLDSLLAEMTGFEMLARLSDQPYYLSMTATVAYLAVHINKCETAKVKREVFKMINTCKKLKACYEGGGEHDSP